MDRNLQRTYSWWIIVLISLSTLTEGRSLHSGSSGYTTNSHIPSMEHGIVQSQPSAGKQQQSAGLRVRPRPVAVHCHPDSMRVVVQADMLDTGLQVDPRHLRLGSDTDSGESECRAVPTAEAEFTIQAHLTDCGTKLSSTKEKIIYSNVLNYSPEPSSDDLLRLNGVTIPVECHYEKRYTVDAISLKPTWIQSVSITSAEDQIDFNLLLMTDDWQFERGSYSYFLGDPIHMEVSAIIRHHMPLRVYVDQCVATATPDAEATLRYNFIERHGCLADAYMTNSSSRFLPRVEQHKLRFQLEAFRFYQEPSNQVYITCYVKAVPVMMAVSSQNRACSLIDNSWKSIDGNDQACRSCDITHRGEEPLSTERPKTTVGTKAWPSTTLQESLVPNRPELHHPSNYIRVQPEMHHIQHNQPQPPSARVMNRGAVNTAERTIQLGPITVLPSMPKIDTRPSGSKTTL